MYSAERLVSGVDGEIWRPLKNYLVTKTKSLFLYSGNGFWWKPSKSWLSDTTKIVLNFLDFPPFLSNFKFLCRSVGRKFWSKLYRSRGFPIKIKELISTILLSIDWRISLLSSLPEGMPDRLSFPFNQWHKRVTIRVLERANRMRWSRFHSDEMGVNRWSL